MADLDYPWGTIAMQAYWWGILGMIGWGCLLVGLFFLLSGGKIWLKVLASCVFGAFQSGSAGNVVAQTALLRLSVRTKTPEDRQLVLDKIRDLTKHQAAGFGCTYEIREGVPGAVLVNDVEETRKAYEIAKAAFGEGDVEYPGPTFLGSEDFAFMFQKRPGTYCFIGNGDTPMVHHPAFVFNPDNLIKGAAYWAALAEGYLR